MNNWVGDTPEDDTPENENEIEVDDETSDMENFGKFPEHLQFVKMIRAAKKVADQSQSKVPVLWRGYKTSVLPQLPPLTSQALKNRLIWALRGINIQGLEREVTYCYS